MQLKSQLDGELVSIITEGKITQAAMDPKVDPFTALLGPGVYERRVLLNLSNSDYIDSSGVSWLLSCHKRFRQAGGSLILHSLPPMVSQILKVLRMDQVLQVAPDASSARELACGGAR